MLSSLKIELRKYRIFARDKGLIFSPFFPFFYKKKQNKKPTNINTYEN